MAQEENSKIEKRIVINLAEQKLYALSGDEIVYEFHCSTARPGRITPVGEWEVTEKLRHNRALPELGGGAIPFSLRLNTVYKGKRRRVLIHAYKDVPKKPASNGCIRLTHTNAEKLFSWAQVGTPVSVIQDSGCGL